MSSGRELGGSDPAAFGSGDVIRPAAILPCRESARAGLRGSRSAGWCSDDRRRAIGDDAGAGIARAVSARHHHRHRDHAGDQAAEEGDQRIRGRAETPGSRVRRAARASQVAPRGAVAPHEFTKCEGGFFRARDRRRRHRRDRPAARRRGAGSSVTSERRFPCRLRLSRLKPAERSSACDEKSRQRVDVRVVVEVVRRQFQAEFVLELHHADRPSSPS